MNTNDRSIVGLTMTAHAMVHTYELSIPILMTIWLDDFAVTKAGLGTIAAVGYALFGLGALPSGVLVDRLGARRLIALCLAGMGGSFLLLSAAPSLALLTLALAGWGLAASVYHPAGLALISKGVVHRGRAFAFHGIAGNAGIALGPLAAAVLLIFLDWRLVAALLALPAAVAVLLALRARFDEEAAVAETPTPTPEPASTGFLANSRQLFTPGFLLVLAIVMLEGLYYRGILTFLPDLLSANISLQALPFGQLDLEPGRYIYAGLLTVGMVGQYAGGLLTDHFRTEWAMAAILTILALTALVFLPVANAGLFPLLLISAVLGFFLFVIQPLYQATVAEYSPAELRGLSYGYTYVGVFGVGALGAAIAGALIDYFGPGTMFAVMAGFAGVAGVLSLVLARRHARQPH